MKNRMKKNKPNIMLRLKAAFKTSLMFSAVLAVIYSGFLIEQIEIPEILPVENIEVTGDFQFLDKSKITAMLKQDLSGGFFTVDLAGLRDSLLLQPWIKEVSLRRKWPASINVFIKEKTPVAYWNKDAYISESGDVFKPEVRINDLMLPALSGPVGHHGDVWKFMNELYSEMALQEYQVIRLELDDRRAWQMLIDSDVSYFTAGTKKDTGNGIIVKLGRFETEKRLQRFVRILPLLTAGTEVTESHSGNQVGSIDSVKKVDVIDMRYPNGFAVQLSSRRMSEA